MLETWDQQLFFLINGVDIHWLDTVVPLYRHKLFWAPLYVFIVAFFLWNFPRNRWWMLLFLVTTVGISDTVSSKWIKPTVERVRPCNDDQIIEQVRIRIRCGGGYSFTSSHATNHAAVAVFLVVLFHGLKRWWGWALIGWALSIGVAQIFVGVHYPFDVGAGWLIGGAIGLLSASVYNRRWALE